MGGVDDRAFGHGPIHNNLSVYLTHWDASIPAGKRDIAAVTELAAIRKVFGDRVDIALECAETFAVRSVIQFATAIAPYRPLFMGEPTLRENPAGLGEVAAKSPVPIATGEGLFSRFGFKQLLDVRGCDNYPAGCDAWVV